jgi:hypothetical protein
LIVGVKAMSLLGLTMAEASVGSAAPIACVAQSAKKAEKRAPVP